MKTQIKLYPAALVSLSAPWTRARAGGRGDTAWATTVAFSCRNTTLQYSQVQAHTRETGDALVATPFAFLGAIHPLRFLFSCGVNTR